jgi:hypothetical protein
VRTEARFPGVEHGAGQYESFYIKATRPGGGQALWIRHTVHKRPGEDANAAVWVTLFDADAAGPQATKVTVPATELSVPTGAYLKVDGATLEPGRAHGRVASPALDAEWDLRFTDRAETFFHLPYQRLYSASLPRTKFLSPHPAALFEGELVVGGKRIAVDSWPGMIGHNWGEEHAERWVWVQGSELAGQPDDALGRQRDAPDRRHRASAWRLRQGAEHEARQ